MLFFFPTTSSFAKNNSVKGEQWSLHFSLGKNDDAAILSSRASAVACWLALQSAFSIMAVPVCTIFLLVSRTINGWDWAEILLLFVPVYMRNTLEVDV